MTHIQEQKNIGSISRDCELPLCFQTYNQFKTLIFMDKKHLN